MYGPDVFAVLSPYRGKYWANTIQAFGHPSNAEWLGWEPPASREPTPDLSSTAEIEDDSVNRLVLKFEQLSHVNEIQAGTDEKASADKKVAHILLKFPGVKAVSARHCIIAARPDNTVYLEDRFSKNGTRVTYDGQEEEREKPHGAWVLAEKPASPRRWTRSSFVQGILRGQLSFQTTRSAHPNTLRS